MARTPYAPVNPEVLRWARLESGFTVDEIAQRLNTKPERVDAWETGDRQPTLGQLRNLAWVMRRPPAFFFRRDTPVSDLLVPPDLRAADHADDLSPQLRRELRSAVDRRSRYLELTGDVEPFHVPVELADPAAAGEAVREQLDFTVQDQIASRDAYAAMHRWIAAVENIGTIVFQTTAIPLDEARGLSIYFERLPVIIVNAKDPIVARSFTLLHELGHLVMGSGALCDVFGQRIPQVETACNRFAASALMPRAAVLERHSPANGLESVARLASQFKVSREAAAIRLFELGELSQAEVQRVRNETRERVESRTGESAPIVPYSTRRLRDLGRSYVGAVLDAYHDDRITLTDASQYLDVKVPHIEKMEAALNRAAEATA